MRILLTGCDGFIGGRLKQDLSQAGHRVAGTTFDRPAGSDEVFLDLSDAASFAKLPAEPFDAVVHAAGIVDQRAKRRRLFAVNSEGTGRLVRWARNNRVGHFIYLSSISVYGWKTMGQNRREERTRRSLGIPVVPYMASKIRAERFIESGGMGYTSLRLPAVLGRGDSYLSPTIITALLNGSFFTCGRLEKKVSLMCAANLGPLIHEILQAGPTGRAFNCCDAHVSWQALIAEYARCLGVEIPRHRRPLLSMISHLGDKHFLLLLTFSRFGAHFPDTLLHAHVPHQHPYSWQTCVAEAVSSYQCRDADLLLDG
jgi:nucleoside-diphosphate-sugar epimerase